ncbi:MAG: PfkB family carbohydrate kinase [Thermomicrobiales bacterium]
MQDERDDLSEMDDVDEEAPMMREVPLLPGAEGRRYDLIGIGEAMLRFTPPNGLRIEQTLSLDLAVGGTELNVAVAMSRIGGRTAWLSKLPDTALGHIIGNQARIHGVDTSHIIWADAADSRLGLFFLESGAVPRAGEIIYDRRNSAAATMTPDDWNWRTLLAQTRVFHITGITPALSASCRAMTFAAVAAAKEAGCAVSCDLNYRAKLWTPEEAAACLRELLPQVDVILTGSSDLKIIFGVSGKPAELATWLRSEFGVPVASVGKRRGNAASGMQARRSVVATDRGVFTSPGVEFQPLDPIGAGDAYGAGFLFGLLSTDDEEQAVAMGDAMAALKHTVPGDFCVVSRAELDAVLSGQGMRLRR